jgi:hypothetical protein
MDDFTVDSDDEFVYTHANDSEETQLSADRRTFLSETIVPVVSNKTYRIQVPQAVSIFRHATSAPNCILNAGWRCTHHFRDFTVNIFKKDVWMLMTKELDEDKVIAMVERNFGMRPLNIRVVNITVLVRLNTNLNLESLHDALASKTLEDILGAGKERTVEGVYLMDKQKFPALIARPFSTGKIILEIYATGAINATGFKSNSEVDMAMDFIKKKVICNI